MALLEQDVAPAILTYEAYLHAGVVKGRYDIVDGVRLFQEWDMTSPLWRHQSIAKRLFQALLEYETRGQGEVLFAPMDMLTKRAPLRVRQPDLLFISHARLAQAGGPPETGPLTVGPELVVEILSASDTRRVLNAKIDEYCAAGVDECWVLSPEAETVEVLRLTPTGPERAALYGAGDTLVSITFPELTLSVSDIFNV